MVIKQWLLLTLLTSTAVLMTSPHFEKKQSPETIVSEIPTVQDKALSEQERALELERIITELIKEPSPTAQYDAAITVLELYLIDQGRAVKLCEPLRRQDNEAAKSALHSLSTSTVDGTKILKLPLPRNGRVETVQVPNVISKKSEPTPLATSVLRSFSSLTVQKT